MINEAHQLERDLQVLIEFTTPEMWEVGWKCGRCCNDSFE
jgi:hypothetical protein